MEYNYRIFLPWTEYAEIMYADLENLDNVRMVKMPFNRGVLGRLIKKIFIIYFYSRLSKYLPFKKVWNQLLFNERIEDAHKLCFVFFMSDLYPTRKCFFKYLKNRYNGCKLVMYFEDIVKSREKNGKNHLDFETLKEYFDMVISYDRSDSEKYGYLYFPTPYSRIELQSDDNMGKSDVFFCGLAKDRFQTIAEVYDKCLEFNLNCDFTVINLPSNNQISNGIRYKTGSITYSDYLKHLKNTFCILDINQKGASGYSLRVWEALVYGKILITNNAKIKNEPFYDPEQFLYFESISDIRPDFFDKSKIMKPRYIEELSPKKMISFIDEKLNKTEL